MHLPTAPVDGLRGPGGRASGGRRCRRSGRPLQRLPVDPNLPVLEQDLIPRQANHALDVAHASVIGVGKYRYVTPVHALLAAGAVVALVGPDPVTPAHAGLHAARRNVEGLDLVFPHIQREQRQGQQVAQHKHQGIDAALLPGPHWTTAVRTGTTPRVPHRVGPNTNRCNQPQQQGGQHHGIGQVQRDQRNGRNAQHGKAQEQPDRAVQVAVIELAKARQDERGQCCDEGAARRLGQRQRWGHGLRGGKCGLSFSSAGLGFEGDHELFLPEKKIDGLQRGSTEPQAEHKACELA